jgi:AraC-like DNA-binding protein
MSNKILYQPFELYVADLEQWKSRALTYHFFEIVHILEGKGTRIVNEYTYPYKEGGIFLFTPSDCRGFESCTATRFCSIRFSGVFLERYKSDQERLNVAHWLNQLEGIFTQHNRSEQVLIKNDADCQMISSLIASMIEEYQGRRSYYDENLQHLITLVLNVISRNVAPEFTPKTSTGEKASVINQLLVYIQQHIYEPEKLKIKNLASEFALSENYIGEFFKKMTGDSLMVYLTKYKMKIIEQRLLYSDYPIARIAEELGFSDESHLSRRFTQHNGMTPAQFRKVKLHNNQ